MAAKVEQYIAETCKMQHSFAWAFRSCAIEFFTQFLQYTALSTQPGTHVAVMREATHMAVMREFSMGIYLFSFITVILS